MHPSFRIVCCLFSFALVSSSPLELRAATRGALPQIVMPQNRQIISSRAIEIVANTQQPVLSIEIFTDGRSFAKGQSISGLTDFQATWRNVSGGDHLLAAVATDLNGGIRSTSGPVAIHVFTGGVEPSDFQFQLSFGVVGTPTNRPTNVFTQSYRFTGPGYTGPRAPGLLLPTMRVVADPSSPRYSYGAWRHLPYQVDSVTGAAKVFAPPQVTDLSFPVGFAADTKRGTVVLATIAGDGALYSYFPHEDRWETLSSLHGIDLRALVYHAPNDSIYGLDSQSMALHRFTGDGKYVGAREIAALPQTGASLSFRMELVSVDPYVLLLAQEYYSGSPGQVVHQFIEVIDVVNDTTQLTYAGTFVTPSSRVAAAPGSLKLMIAAEGTQELTLPTDGGLQIESTSQLNSPEWTPINTDRSSFVQPTNSQQFFRIAPKQ